MPKSMRGFAAKPPTKRKAIAALGGKAAHTKGVAHRWTRREASKAGRKGRLKRKGVRMENKRSLKGHEVAQAHALNENRNNSIEAICKKLHISPPTLYHYVKANRHRAK